MNSILDVMLGQQGAQEVVVTHEVPSPAPASSAVEVIPYNACADPEAKHFLPWCWQKMQDDDLVDLYFPGQRDTGFATFVRMFSGDANVAIFKAGDESLGNTWEARIPGFITWTPLPMGACNSISAGFIFFRKWWGHGITDEAARAAFTFWFDKLNVDIVLGSCPSLHKLAIRYNERVGLKEIGRIPKGHLYKEKVCDAILYAMTRDAWKERA